ncbi:hypothetical protein [Crassaminicella profunda]|uniref:hypothetical protein n=1 Tax=Crassaminicella profunda TaxID=1286698 RepID=UPI001CA78102|nr:hypothetical protein [Crassaminicella profunda]QZY56691.1 hypothetical protein K7H06_07160 [Crassaminicella profunda]
MCKEGKWMYELHGSDIWQGEKFDTREECIEEARKEVATTNKSNKEFGYKTIDKFRIGKTEDAGSYGIDADDILERISENAYDDIGEVAEDYLTDVKPEHEKELEEKLNEVLFAWMKKYKYEPSFYRIIDIEEIKVD